MVKIGDFVRIKKNYKDRYWYNEEVFIVINKFKTYNDISVVVLDRPYYDYAMESKTQLMEIYVEVATSYIRSKKIKQILDD